MDGPESRADSATSVRTRGADHYEVVLVLILAALVLAPFETTPLRPLIVALLGLSFLFALWTSGSSGPLMTWCAVAVTVGVVAAAASQAASGASPRLVFATLSLVLCASTITAIVRRLSAQLRVTRRTVTGALSIYLLIGLLFAYLFTVIGVARTAGFFAQPGAHDSVAYLYFSYITLTTIGYGDLTAGTDAGRMLAVIEALIGQLYLVTVVAVVVANIGRERARHRGDPES